jgi:hypothetical protein
MVGCSEGMKAVQLEMKLELQLAAASELLLAVCLVLLTADSKESSSVEVSGELKADLLDPCLEMQ